MKKTVITLALFALFIWVSPLGAAMTGGTFIIVEDGFSFVESVTSTGGTFNLLDFGDYSAGKQTGDDLALYGGFYFPEAESTLSFSVDANTIDLGTLSESAVASDAITLTVTAASSNGYTVSITEDGDLRSGANTIDDVSDGAVSAGSEEYGIKTTGSAGLLASDTAISGTVNVMSNSSSATNETVDVTFSASIGGSSQSGSYAHSVTFTATVNP